MKIDCSRENYLNLDPSCEQKLFKISETENFLGSSENVFLLDFLQQTIDKTDKANGLQQANNCKNLSCSATSGWGRAWARFLLLSSFNIANPFTKCEKKTKTKKTITILNVTVTTYDQKWGEGEFI